MLPSNVTSKLHDGCVIPAHPLALTQDHRLDERHQRALTRYYLSAGVGGLAVGVHTTQFPIHDPKVGLYKPVLELACDTVDQWSDKADDLIMIAGIVGRTDRAIEEAQLAKALGYHIGLLSLAPLKGEPIDKLIDHTRAVAEIIPVMGFYLQPAISGMVLPIEFWRKFVEIPNVSAIKIAPFDQYQTLDVIEAVAQSDRRDEIALYTGNDDSIIINLLTDFDFVVNGKTVRLKIVGGLLGQWACWTHRAVEIFNQIKTVRQSPQKAIPSQLLTLAYQLTLANAAIFDAGNNFTGCIPGISYVLKRVGLIEEIRMLDPHDKLSPGQENRIEKIIRDYPQLTDDDFVKENLSRWLQ